MNGDRPLRVGDRVRPVHPQYGPQEPGVVIGFRHDRCMAADAREVQIRRSDGTVASYMVHDTWRMEPLAAGVKTVIVADRRALHRGLT